MCNTMRKKIAVVDDDSELLETLEIILDGEGYDVDAIGSKIKLKAIEDIKPDLLIIDVWFGDEPFGIQLAKSVKSDDSLDETTLLLVSSDPRIREYARQTKADYYLEKPFSIEELLRKIDYALH